MPAKNPKLKLSEADIERACVDFMQLDGWRPLKTDPTSDRSRGKGFGEIGMADVLFIRYANDNPYRRVAGGYRGDQPDYKPRGWAEMLWVEFKRPGGKPTPLQLEWHTLERVRGGCTWIATINFDPTVEGFIEHYRNSGLLRREGL